MFRRAATLVCLVVLSTPTLYAQDVAFTISVASADVHQGPSIGTPVIGHVPHDTAMPVLRNLGSWVKVPWPAAPDGFAYVYITMGRLTPPSTNTPTSAAPPRTTSATSGAAPAAKAAPSLSSSTTAQTTIAPRPHPATHERVVIRTQQGATPISHVIGFGGVVGSMSSFGATARKWRDDRLGFQVGFTRDSTTSDVATDRVTAMQVEPAVVYGLFDHVSDYFWLRPYVGSGVSIRHQTLHQSTPVDAEVASNTGVGLHLFGGGEVTFAGMPRFALSVEFGYRRLPTPFPGFPADHLAMSVAGHWYVK